MEMIYCSKYKTCIESSQKSNFWTLLLSFDEEYNRNIITQVKIWCKGTETYVKSEEFLHIFPNNSALDW